MGPHISYINKASFIKRNIKIANKKIKQTAYNYKYKALVRPGLEYASPAWDPYTSDNINILEKVQELAARLDGYYIYTAIHPVLTRCWMTCGGQPRNPEERGPDFAYSTNSTSGSSTSTQNTYHCRVAQREYTPVPPKHL